MVIAAEVLSLRPVGVLVGHTHDLPIEVTQHLALQEWSVLAGPPFNNRPALLQGVLQLLHAKQLSPVLGPLVVVTSGVVYPTVGLGMGIRTTAQMDF